MGETHHHYQPAPPSSRLGIKTTVGEIVEVQGGHIVRSTGRKDRHSKVCTAKGPRDRRVRLSAHTAIQFYDVQDRLGYDRPSKAVDWLIKKAKAAIDELEELPAWHPSTTAPTAAAQQEHMNEESEEQLQIQQMQSLQQQMGENRSDGSSFLPPSMDSDSIADTIKSFFPMGASAETPSSSTINFQNYPPDLLSRTSSQNQDLRLSLQSFQDPIILHQTQQEHQNNHHVLFSGTNPMGFDGSSPAGWSEHHQHHPEDISRFQRMIAWNAGGDTGSSGSGSAGGGGGGGFMFKSPAPPQLQPLFGQNQFLSQRGPLQSSNTPYVRAWIDPQLNADHQYNHRIPSAMLQSSVSGFGFAPSGYSGFSIPARIQGEEEEHDGISNKPSSVSSDSRH